MVERRIILDSAFLDVGNETLNTPENRYAIGHYIERLNRVREEAQLPVIVSEIQGVPTKQTLCFSSAAPHHVSKRRANH